MASLTYTEISTIVKNRGGFNTATDSPVSASELQDAINEAYADLWEISGGRIKITTSANAWTLAESCTGILAGILADVSAIEHLYATTQAPLSLGATSGATSKTLTSSAAFVSPLTQGFEISGTNITAGTRIASIASTSSLEMTAVSGGSGGSSTKTFSPTTGPYELTPVDLDYIKTLRSMSGMPTYKVPKHYAVTRLASPPGASLNLLQLDYWPSVTGFYFPMEYTPQFSPYDGSTVTTIDLNDLEGRDCALLAAARLCVPLDRSDFVPSILADISARTQKALERKLAAIMDSKADRIG